MKNLFKFSFGILLLCILIISSVLLLNSVHKSTTSLAAAPAPRLYVANSGSTPGGDTVSVIDTGSNVLIGSVPVGSQPTRVIVSPDRARVYVANTGDNTVSVIDTASNTVTATIPLGSGTSVVDMALNSSGTRLYTANGGCHCLVVVDTTANSVLATIPLTSDPTALAVHPNGNLVYVIIPVDSLDIVDTSTNTVTNTISMPHHGPSVANQGMVFNSTGTKLFLTAAEGFLSIIDTVTNVEVASLTVSPVSGVPVLNTNGTTIYAAGAAGNISAVDPNANTWTTSIPESIQGPNGGVVVNAANSKLYVTNTATNTVSAIDISTGRTLAIIPVGSGPLGVALKP